MLTILQLDYKVRKFDRRCQLGTWWGCYYVSKLYNCINCCNAHSFTKNTSFMLKYFYLGKKRLYLLSELDWMDWLALLLSMLNLKIYYCWRTLIIDWAITTPKAIGYIRYNGDLMFASMLIYVFLTRGREKVLLLTKLVLQRKLPLYCSDALHRIAQYKVRPMYTRIVLFSACACHRQKIWFGCVLYVLTENGDNSRWRN